MIMNYPSATRRKGRGFPWWGVLLCALALFALASLSRPWWLEHFFGLLDIRGLWQERVVLLWQSKQELEEENQFLREQILRSSVALTLSEYNQRTLQELLALDAQTVPAQVLLRPPYSAYDYYVLNQGADEGVALTQLVVVGGQYLVGYIDEVTPGHSRARLFSAPRETFLVSIEGILYPAEGEGGGTVSIRLPRNFRDLSEKTVTIPGTAPYVLGVIETTSFEPQDSYVRGVMNLPVNIFEQEWVEIVSTTFEDFQEEDLPKQETDGE